MTCKAMSWIHFCLAFLSTSCIYSISMLFFLSESVLIKENENIATDLLFKQQCFI